MKIPPTICRDCIFAEYNRDGHQADCAFHDRLWKLQSNGATLTQVSEADKTYYKIENRVCNACRNNETLKRFPKKDWRSQVEDQIKIRLTYVIVATQQNSLEDMIKTISLAEDQNPPPYSILVVIDPANAPTSFDSVDVVDYLRTRSVRKWMVEDLNFDEAMKYNIKHFGLHYTVFFGGADIPIDFSKRINRAINFDMRKILAIRPDAAGNGGFIKTGINLDQLLESEGAEHYIKDFEDL